MSTTPARAPAGPFCQVIRFPGCAVTAQLNDSFLRRLNAELLTFAHQEAGISGVLLGAFGSEDSRLIVVEDFENTPPPSANARRHGSLDDLLKTWEPHWGSRLCAVGIFATRRPGVARQPVEQAAALASLFPHALGIILLATSETGRLELFLAEDGAVRSDSPHVSVLAFPENAVAAPLSPHPEERVSEAVIPMADPRQHLPLPVPQVARKIRTPWLAAGAILIAGLGAAGGWYFRSNGAGQTGSSAANTLSLTVERAAGGFELRWSRDSEAIRRGQAGVLKVVDGSAVKMIALTPAQLAIGRIIYVPRSEDVEFSMQVISDGNQLTTDGARIVRNLGFDAPVFEAPAVETPWSGSSGLGGRGSEPVARKTVSETPRAKPEETPSNAEQDASKSFRPPPAPATKPKMPAVAVADPAPQLAANLKPALPASTPLPVHLPTLTTPPPDQQSAGETRVSSLVPPEPMVKRPLSIHPDMRRRLPTNLQMKVRLSIDAGGRVIAVKPVTEVTKISEPFYRLAAESASKWVFKPAILNGQPVASECDLTFQLK